MTQPLPPKFDQYGLNILDPKDELGIKSAYINLIQTEALSRYLPNGNADNLALDIGCGYGHLSTTIARKGWRVIGIDPSFDLLSYAQINYPQVKYCQSALPNLPVQTQSVDLIILHNVLRALMKLNMLYKLNGIGKFLSKQGKIAVVDNIKSKPHPDYVSENEIMNIFIREGFVLEQRIPFRGGRWWLLYLIRYGFIPRTWLKQIACYELSLRQKQKKIPNWQYLNVLFIFRSLAK